MDSTLQSSILTALAAILGSAVGGLSTFTTTFFSQRAASRRDLVTKELAHREMLYADLMKEATNAWKCCARCKWQRGGRRLPKERNMPYAEVSTDYENILAQT
jgi:hypothetical protein